MRELLIVLTTFATFWPAFFILGLVLFRQKVTLQYKKIILASFLMSHVTLFVQSISIPMAIGIIQPLCAMLCFWLLFRIKFLYCVIMTLILYFFSGLEEFLIDFTLAGFQKEAMIILFQETVVVPSIIIGLVNYTLSYLLYRFRLGFTFVRTFNSPNITTKKDAHLLMIIYLSLLLMCSISFFIYHWTSMVLAGLSLSALFFIFLIQQLYQKEIDN